MIFVTGDTHGYSDFNKLPLFLSKHPELGRGDYVIIAGDFGAIWDYSTLARDLSIYESLPVTILFVDGNHENFNLLRRYKRERLFGGDVQRISDNIIHLMRGQVYEIEGNKIFTFGGGTSIDKEYRIEGLSWWRAELPSDEEIREGFRNLRAVENRVDYVITHSCDMNALLSPSLMRSSNKHRAYFDNEVLSEFEKILDYKRWYFGHYHADVKISEKKRALYQDIIPLGE